MAIFVTFVQDIISKRQCYACDVDDLSQPIQKIHHCQLLSCACTLTRSYNTLMQRSVERLVDSFIRCKYETFLTDDQMVTRLPLRNVGKMREGLEVGMSMYLF